MTGWLVFSAFFFIGLGCAYVMGYDLVKKHSPQHLVHFYLLMSAIRLLLTAIVAAVCLLTSSDKENTIEFVAIYLIMYAMMMVVTLTLRH